MTGIAEGLECFAPGSNFESQCLGAVLVAGGALVSLGLLTPYAAMAVAIAIAYRELGALPMPPSVLLKGSLPRGIVCVLGVSVSLLGPGLFSLDFRLFGRREIVIPRRGQE